MTTPRILDAKGREIRVGDRVHEGDSLPGLVFTVGEDEGRVIVDVVYAFDFTTVDERYFAQPQNPLAEYPDPHTYTCPDLQLLDDREESSNGN